MPRVFIAVDIPDTVRMEVASCLREFEKCGAEVRWVKPENLHLTVMFLGQAPPEKVGMVREGLGRVAAESAPFQGRLAGFGAFPNFERPQVLWVGMKEGAKELAGLAQKTVATMKNLGFEADDKTFSAHLTIGRVKGTKNLKALADKMRSTSFESRGMFEVRSLALYNSRTLPDGAVYEMISREEFRWL